ncbi:MAG: hypothetical protein PHX04_04030 [Bacilli bacterium]|nr:hypothetical protein [Bacilli bacterium]
MNTFFRFFYEFIAIFFSGFEAMAKGFWKGLTQMFNFKTYKTVLTGYKDSFNGAEWILVGLSIAVLVIIVISIVLLIFFMIRRLIRYNHKNLNQEDLLDEINNLNTQVDKLMKEKNEIMAMKVSQLGLKPGEEETMLEEGEESNEEVDTSDSRFPKLSRLDIEFKEYKVKKYSNTFTLAELAENFRCYTASQLKLYYDISLLRSFIAGLACGRLVILQGISGTGKTSLAYAWGKFVKNDACIASVEPSWRDKTELLGYFNEFTKKFNESDVLAELYKAGYTDDVHTIILDEMNIARVEYYFAEMLSILELPSREEWIIELVTNGWPDDPKNVVSGKLKLPENLWYIGTINNDDSTFMVTDKVYDRAMPIDINTKVAPFKCRDQEALDINSSYLEKLFADATENYPISATSLKKVEEMDNYIIKHFRVAFGNRILKQLNIFVPVYVASGGDEVDAIDYFIAKKIFRKIEQINILFIKDEIDPFINYLNKSFGNGKMKECIEFLERIKKAA